MSIYETVYNVQVKTFKIACDLTDQHHDAIPMDQIYKPPYCLRIVPKYRTPEILAFRKAVAIEARKKFR